MECAEFSAAKEELPNDPNDRYYYTNCYVCKAKAKPGTEYMHNYGGLVCFSCRAFWRRAHKKTKNPSFVCSRGDSCDITVANRRKCKKCRFRLCQQAGMTESAILTEEQKKLRFRKMLQKREALMQLQNNGVKEESKSPPQADNAYYQQMALENGGHDHPKLEADEGETSLPSASSFSALSEVDSLVEEYEHAQLHPMSSEPGSPCCRSNEIVLKRKESIVTCFEITLGLTNSTADDELFATWNPHLREDFLTHFSNVAEEFKNFAFFQRHFCQMSPEAQEHLLATNTPLFNQLHMVCCLLDPRESSTPDPAHLQQLYMARLESIVQLFESRADLEYYCSLVMRLRVIQDLTSVEHQAILAYIILFNMSADEEVSHISNGLFEDVSIINEVFFKKFIKKSVESFGIEELISILERMASLCAEKMGMNLKTFCPDSSPPQSFQEQSWMSYSNPAGVVEHRESHHLI